MYVGLQIPFTIVITVGFLPALCLVFEAPGYSVVVSTGLPLGLFAHKRSMASLCLSLNSDMDAIGAALSKRTGRRNTIHVAWSFSNAALVRL